MGWLCLGAGGPGARGVALSCCVVHLVQRLQESQVSNSELQEHVKDLQQQLASASTGSLLQQQEAEGLTAAMETRHEQDMMKQMTQMNEWKARCQQLEEQVQLEGEAGGVCCVHLVLRS